MVSCTTYSDVNSATFGVVYSAHSNDPLASGSTVSVDYISITVYYSITYSNQYDYWYPQSWTGGFGWNASTTSMIWNNAYLHYWVYQSSTLAVTSATKGIYQTIGTNPPPAISFAIYGNILPAAGNIIEVRIRDLTSGKVLNYEYGTGGSIVRTSNSSLKTMHSTIIASNW